MVTLGSQSLQEGSVDDGLHLHRQLLDLRRRAAEVLAAAAALDRLRRAPPRSPRSLLGLPAGVLHRRRRPGRWKNVMLVLVVAPFFTSFLIRTLAWRTILSDTGPVTSIFQALHITDLLQFLHLTNNDTLLSSKFAVICGLTYNFLPFMILPLYAALDRLDPRLRRGRRRPVRLAAGRASATSPGRCRCPASSRARCSPSSRPPVTTSTRALLGNTQTVMIGQVIDSQFLRVLDYPTGRRAVLHPADPDPRLVSRATCAGPAPRSWCEMTWLTTQHPAAGRPRGARLHADPQPRRGAVLVQQPGRSLQLHVAAVLDRGVAQPVRRARASASRWASRCRSG